jgi:hypothetical protein
MPTLSSHPTRSIVKLLAFGESKTGKTGSLVSLVQADFKLFILDFDNLLGILRRKVLEVCPDKADNVHYISLIDKFKVGMKGTDYAGKPTAWLESLRLLNNWRDGEEDYGNPAEWPDDHILVIDSLSRWCDAAYNLHDQATPKTGKSGGDYDGRAAYWSSQDDMEKQIATITSPSFSINTIVIGHGVYMKLDDGTTRILPQGIGSKLSPRFPTYFPNVVYYRNKDDKRTIQLESNRMVNLSNDASLTGDLPIETGLATIFAALRGQPSESKPQARHTLKRISA